MQGTVCTRTPPSPECFNRRSVLTLEKRGPSTGEGPRVEEMRDEDFVCEWAGDGTEKALVVKGNFRRLKGGSDGNTTYNQAVVVVVAPPDRVQILAPYCGHLRQPILVFASD